MKYVILLGDGMADEPVEALGGKTPLEAARTPHMDRIAGEGTLGRIDTIPPNFPPGSDVATLSVLGYDPRKTYTGRGPLEAANMGVMLGPEDVAFRCNLVTLSDGDAPVMADFTAGHISSEEARILIADLDRALGSDAHHFYPGVGYRHLFVWKHGRERMTTTPPHDIVGGPAEPCLPRGEGAEVLVRLMRESRAVLRDHPVNRERLGRGKKAANSAWFWGQGKAPRIVRLTDRYGITGGMISAVDLLNGIGIYAGLEVIRVPGATGYTDTNYAGKAAFALEALREKDLVFVHVEATDEMGHEGNLEGKIRALEDFDEKVVGAVLAGLPTLAPFRILVLSDHPTPVRLKTHAADPSPFAVLSSVPGENQAAGALFSEPAARAGGLLVSPGSRLLGQFLTDWRQIVHGTSL